VTSALSAAAQNNNTDLRIALDVTEEWEKFDEGALCQGCIVVTNSFKNEHPEQYAKFLEEYAASAEYVVTEIDAASAIIAEFGIIPKAPLAKKAIPNANICFVDGEDGIAYMKSVLDVLYNANPSSVGGKLPDDAFYGK
jgi:NitT/TauT family transport system substrate-binding protein